METLPGVWAKEVEISWACRGGGVRAAAAVVVVAGSSGLVLRRLVSGEVEVRMAAECDVRTVRILSVEASSDVRGGGVLAAAAVKTGVTMEAVRKAAASGVPG